MPEVIQSNPRQGLRSVVALALCLEIASLVGCDKIQIPDLGQQPAAAPAPGVAGSPAPQADTNPAPAPVAQPVQSAKPAAKEVVAAFLEKASRPGAVNDQDVIAVTELTEGLDEVKELRLSGAGITDVAAACLSKFPNLTLLDLSGSQITNAAVPVIKLLPDLKVLGLGYTPVDDKGMVVVGEIKDLKELYLANTRVTDFGLSQLGNLEHLEVLDISQAGGITGSSFKQLKSSKSLRVIRAHHSGLRGEFMKFLSACPIEELNLEATGMSDEGMLTIGKMEKMQKLNLAFCNITDFGVKKMVVMKDLDTISVRNNAAISNLLFTKLMKSKKLKYVDATGTRISPTDAAKLMKLIPECRVIN